MPEIKATDWAYAAGFVDGEGCIAIVRSFVPSRDRFVYSVHIVVANNGRGVLDWMQSNWGGLGSVRFSPWSRKRRSCELDMERSDRYTGGAVPQRRSPVFAP